jgi:hypothetical protein
MGSLALPAWPLFTYNPVKMYVSSSRDGLLSHLLSTLRPSWHIIGVLWRSWIFQKCADYTTRSFTHLMISNRGFHDAQFMYCPTHCPHRRPTEVQPRTCRGYPLQTPHRMCTRDADRMPLGAHTPWRSRELIDSLPVDSIDVDRAALSEHPVSLVAHAHGPPSTCEVCDCQIGKLFAITAAYEPSQWLCQVSKEQTTRPLWLPTWLMSGGSKIDSSGCT